MYLTLHWILIGWLYLCGFLAIELLITLVFYLRPRIGAGKEEEIKVLLKE